MKASDVIQQIYYALSKEQTSYFSGEFVISAFSSPSSGVYQVTTTQPHGLQVGSFVSLGGLLTPTAISDQVENADDLYINTHPNDHDLTLARGETKSVTLFDNFGFTYTANLIAVQNRYEFTMEKTGSFTGFPANPLFVGSLYDFGYNDVHQVTAVPSATTFRFESDTWLSPSIYEATFENALVRGNFNVGGAIDIDTAENDYTAQPKGSMWLFVVLGDCNANKDRFNTNDMFNTPHRQGDQYAQIISNMSIYCFIPNQGDDLVDTSGRSTRDLIEDVVRPFIFRALIGINFPTYLSNQTQSSLSYAGDQYVGFNEAYYIHRFDFQQVMTLTNEDCAVTESTRAFRDLDLQFKNQFSELTEYTAAVNIDEEPYTP